MRVISLSTGESIIIEQDRVTHDIDVGDSKRYAAAVVGVTTMLHSLYIREMLPADDIDGAVEDVLIKLGGIY